MERIAKGFTSEVELKSNPEGSDTMWKVISGGLGKQVRKSK